MAFLDKTGLERVWANTVALADTKVPTSRTVNGKPLSTDITLNASDVGADSSGSADKALDNAKSYTDSQIANKANKSTTLSGYGIADAYTKTDIDGKVSTLNTAINGKAASSHPHSIADVDGLQNELDGKLSTSGGTMTGDLAVPSIISSRKLSAHIQTSGWYRIFTSNDSDVAGDTINFVLSHNYYNQTTETYEFSVSVGYSGRIDITQLSGVNGNDRVIPRIRVVSKASSIYYIDFYYNTVVVNAVTVFGTGAGTFQVPTAVDSIPPDGYRTYEFETVNGCGSSNGFTGDLVGNATSATKATQDGDGNTITSTYAGRRVGGKNFTVEEQVLTAGEGAEMFNDYTNNYAIGRFSHAEGSCAVALGDYSHAEGSYVMSIGNYSHTEGYNTTAKGDYSHAEGEDTIAANRHSHAEGCSTDASGAYSHAEGYSTAASGYYSHAEGYDTEAYGDCSHAEGYATTALDYQHAQGHYNNTATAKPGVPSGQGSTGSTAFVIGCGTSTSAANAFRVEYSGQIYALSAIKSTGRDYAEYFEWQDLNLDAEDRRGYFVTLDGDKIKIAEPNDYILGIVSGQPSVVGNGDEDWRGRYILDEFGAFITEEFEYEEEVWDKETNESRIVTKTGIKYKENPEYDPSLDYIQREDRPEWDAVGMMGVLSVRDDGTCEVNGYCKVAEGGIATASETGYRVIKRINDNIVEVIFR